MGVVDVKATQLCIVRNRRLIGDNDVTVPGMLIDDFTVDHAVS
jgi:hypothetical protein